MDYTLRELECFSAVAEELSFTRAARRLHLAQPPLSRHIRALEEKIGAPLFDRQPRAVALTPAGRAFHEESRGLLAQLIRAGDTARRAAHGEETRLRLGFVSAVLGGEIVRVLKRFREAHPSVQLVLHDLPPSEQMKLIAEGRLDGGFVGLTPAERTAGLRFIPWWKERLLTFVPSGHPLSARTRVDLAALRTERFVAVSSEAAPAFSLLVHDLCRKAGFRPRIVLESSRAQAVAVMVAAGSGIAILPESLGGFVGASAPGIPLKGSPEITHVFACPSSPPSAAMKNLLESLAPAPGPKERRAG
jgi:DNA-binding transcriptional LysR family regulator